MDVPRDIAFRLERFGWTGVDRIELAGRWRGLRGRRLARPVLVLHGVHDRRRLLAILDEDPEGAPGDDQEWVVAFPWSGDRFPVEHAELDVGPDLVVDLPAPEPSAATRAPIPVIRLGAGGSAAPGSTTPASVEPVGATPEPVVDAPRPAVRDAGPALAASSADPRAEARAARAEAAALAHAAEAAEARLRRELYATAQERDRLRAELERARAQPGAAQAELERVRREAQASEAGLRGELERASAASAASADEAEEWRTVARGLRDELAEARRLLESRPLPTPPQDNGDRGLPDAVTAAEAGGRSRAGAAAEPAPTRERPAFAPLPALEAATPPVRAARPARAPAPERVNAPTGGAARWAVRVMAVAVVAALLLALVLLVNAFL